MTFLMVSLPIVWLGVLGGDTASAHDDEASALFAGGAIEPSEMTLILIGRIFHGRMSAALRAHHEKLDRALLDGDWRGLEHGIKALENEVSVGAALN